MTTSVLSCPTCGRTIAISDAKHLPFCSDRCRLIDLGRWLDEQQSVPVAKSESQLGASPPPLSMASEDSERPPVRLPPGWHDA